MTNLNRMPAGLARLVPGRLSTGTKMLLILTLALLPLGLIALFASIQSARVKQNQREADARIIATAEARQIDILLLRGATLIRNGLSGATPRRCKQLGERAATMLRGTVPVALFDARGRRICATPDFSPLPIARPTSATRLELRLEEEPTALRFVVSGPGNSYGAGELPVSLLRDVLSTTDVRQGLTLIQDDDALQIVPSGERGMLDREMLVEASVAGGQARLQLHLLSNAVSATEILLVLLPVLMWAAAAGIGWIVVDQLLLRPLAQLQRAVSAYGATGDPMILPRLSTPSQEIKALGESFQQTTSELIQREIALEEALNHQVRLTREVHHRVKNNLQVVASLINLHARGTRDEVAGAYASIQRRVDALAVVHRNHYAELEENRGVALRSIVAELSANLRGNADPRAAQLTITLDMIPAFVSQDVAVPVAFLVTEIVELAMNCDPKGTVAIILAASESQDRAILTLEAAGLTEAACAEHPARDRFQRIVTGLARQLRAQLEFDGERGSYRIPIAIVPDGRSERNGVRAG